MQIAADSDYIAPSVHIMLYNLQNFLSLSGSEVIISLVVVLFAGMVRGFAGFGMSALIMAGLALIIPPVTLIPVCFIMETLASFMMFRGGVRMADHKVVWGLVIGTVIGTPIGLMATMAVTPDTSRTIALVLILLLALLQLRRRPPAVLGTRKGLYGAGLTAGIASGLASVGGMVVALYVLAQQAPAARMRASLVMYLALSMIATGVWLYLSGMLNMLVLQRAIVFAPVVILGVLLGTRLFRPSLEQFYKRFCLGLLMSVAVSGLIRMAMS